MVVIHKMGRTAAGTSTNGIKFKIPGLVFPKEEVSQIHIEYKAARAGCSGEMQNVEFTPPVPPGQRNVEASKGVAAKCQRPGGCSPCPGAQGWQGMSESAGSRLGRGQQREAGGRA